MKTLSAHIPTTVRPTRRYRRAAASVCLESLEMRTLMSVSLDANGWTVVTPSVDTRIIYVSSSAGSDSNNGLSAATPVKTIAKGESLLSSGVPDWLLLKSGDTWNEAIGGWNWDGRSAQEPSLISYYGTTGDRPLLKTGLGDGLDLFGSGSRNNLDIIGIKFYANGRDPKSPDFAGTADSTGLIDLMPGSNILIEDCVFQGYKDNIVIEPLGGMLTNFTLRRSMILDAYSTDAHAQGLYMSGVNGALIEENVFDHNGWNSSVPGAEATIFNHNMYLQYSNTGNVIVRHNISAEASSHGAQMRSGGIADGNLFVSDAISLLLGTDDNTDPNMLNHTGQAINNVILNGSDIVNPDPSISGTRGWGLDLNPGTGWVASSNIIAHDSSADNGGHAIGIDSASVGATVSNNVIYQWAGNIQNGSGSTVLLNNTINGTGYPDPTRSVGSYDATLGGPATLAAFLTAARARTVHSWDVNYSAVAVIDYIRAGFGMAALNGVAAPSGLTATAASSTQINLTWTNNATNQTGLILDRSTNSAFTLNLTTTNLAGTPTSYSVTGLTGGTTYYFRLRAVAATLTSSNSNTASATTTAVASLPAAPSSLVASVISSSQINLTWTDNANNETGFTLDRATDSGFTQNLVSVNLAASTVSYNVTGLTAGTTYYVRVLATNATGSSANSNTANATTAVAALAAPSALAATATSSTQVNLTWTDNANNETGFTLDLGATDSGFTQTLTSVNLAANTIAYNATGLASGTTYYFRVRATNAAGSSANSNTANATTAATLPAAPSALVATTVSSSQINLTWTDNANNETGMSVDVATDSGFTQNLISTNLAAGSTAYSAVGLAGTTNYYFRVRATNAAGSSANSNTDSSTTGLTPNVWVNQPLAAQSGSFVADFDAQPLQANTDTVIGLSSSAASQYSDVAAIVRFNATGTIDVRNGGAYAVLTTVSYNANTSYHFTMVVRLSQNQYDVYVTPEGGVQVLLAQNYAFRTEQTGVATLANYAACSSTVGTATLANMTVTQTGVLPVTINANAVNNVVVSATPVNVVGTAGNDQITFDLSGGVPSGTVNLDGSTGNNTLTVHGTTSSQNITFNGTQMQVDSLFVNLTNIQTVVLDGGGNLTATGGTITLLNSQQLGAVSLANNARLVVQAGTASVLTVTGLSLTGTSLIDLNNSDMIVHNASLVTVTNYLSTGHIISTTAAGTNGLMSLGSLSGKRYHSTNGAAATFHGLVVVNSDVLIKYTLTGDANLDGRVSIDDYIMRAGGKLFG